MSLADVVMALAEIASLVALLMLEALVVVAILTLLLDDDPGVAEIPPPPRDGKVPRTVGERKDLVAMRTGFRENRAPFPRVLWPPMTLGTAGSLSCRMEGTRLVVEIAGERGARLVADLPEDQVRPELRELLESLAGREVSATLSADAEGVMTR